MRRTGRTPIDDDAEKTEIRPLEASMPLSIMGIFKEYKIKAKHMKKKSVIDFILLLL